jgi:polyhydroxyalkanoate synthesis regulator phasin
MTSIETTTPTELVPFIEEINAAQEKRKKEIERRIVVHLSRGNILLQQGEYQTQEDIDRLREEVLSRDFNKRESS